MKRLKALSWILLLTTVGCRTTLQPEKPMESYLPWNKEPESSFIQFPLQLDLNTIEALVNKNLQGVLYENPALKTGEESSIGLKVSRTGRIRLGMDGNTLTWEIPLRIEATTRLRIGIGSLGFTDTRQMKGEIALRFNTAVEISPDWSLKTKTSPAGYKWIEEPSVTASGKMMPVTLLANIILNNTQSLLTQRLDELFQQNLALEPQAELMWLKLQDPMKVWDEPEIWLKLTPEEIYATQPSAKQGTLQWKAALKAKIEAQIGSMPSSGVPVPLKKINLWVPQTPSSYVFARISARLDTLAATAEKFLKNEKFSSGNKSVRVKTLSLYGNEGMLVAEVTLEGSVNGKVYFKGTPYYDASTQVLRIQNFDFDLHTRNILQKSAAWLLQSTIKKQILKYLCFDLESQLTALQQGIDQWSENFRPVEGIQIKGAIKNLEPDAIHITPDAIVVYLKAIGNIEISSNPLLMK
ncbi:MAG: DUF4403 family protein [Bacteroidales bacterium]